MGLLEFFSAQAGQDRRKRLDQAGERIGGLLDYYLGPTGIPQRLGAAGGLLGYTDAGDMVEAADASRALWNDPTIANFGRYGTAAAAMMLPAVTARAINDGVDVAGDLARFGADESGAIRVWHGSPHDFDRFSMDKIGTGEGAQAYGHGLYFAESPDVAKGYQQRLANIDAAEADAIGIPPSKWNAFTMFARQADPTQAEAAARDFANWTGSDFTPELVEAYRRTLASRGRLYEVDINANPDDFLDWDRPLGEQPEIARRLGLPVEDYEEAQRLAGVLDKAGLTIAPDPEVDSAIAWLSEPTDGGLKREALLSKGGMMYARDERLRKAGIPGIRYLDAGSRGAGDGSRNYVVFDENLVQIVKKYGIAGAAAVLGLSQAEVAQAMERRQPVAQTPPRLD